MTSLSPVNQPSNSHTFLRAADATSQQPFNATVNVKYVVGGMQFWGANLWIFDMCRSSCSVVILCYCLAGCNHLQQRCAIINLVHYVHSLPQCIGCGQHVSDEKHWSAHE